MSRLAIGLILLLALPFLARSQTQTITVEAEIVWAGIDRPGDLFVLLANGEVQKYEKTGKKVGSHRFGSLPTLIDPLDGVRSFFYFRQGQRYGTLSYDFSDVDEKVLDPSFAISPWLVCPALRELWILDSADFSVKKTRLNSQTISLESTLKHLPDKKISDYGSMREYQNYVFLLDKTAGVHVFNPIGRFVHTLGKKNMNYFNFLGEELYYVSGNDLVLIDIYNLEMRTRPLPGEYTFALLNDDHVYGIKGKEIHITPFRP